MTTIASLAPATYVGALGAPGVDVDVPAPTQSGGSKLPAIAVLAAGGSLALASVFGRGANPLLRLGGGIAGLGFAAIGAMMLTMGDSPKTSGSSVPASKTSGAEVPSAPQVPLGFNQERRDGRTPNGGAYSIASYFDGDGNAAAKAEATNVVITEYSADGSQIAETVGTLGHS